MQQSCPSQVPSGHSLVQIKLEETHFITGGSGPQGLSVLPELRLHRVSWQLIEKGPSLLKGTGPWDNNRPQLVSAHWSGG